MDGKTVIRTKLRQVEVPRGQGMSTADAVRQIGIPEPTFFVGNPGKLAR